MRVRDEQPSEDEERKQLDADQDKDDLRQPADRYQGHRIDHEQHDDADRRHRTLARNVAGGIADGRAVEGRAEGGKHERGIRCGEVGVRRQNVGKSDADRDAGHRPQSGRDDAREVHVFTAGAGDCFQKVLVGEHRDQPDRRAKQQGKRHLCLVERHQPRVEVDERIDDGDRRQRDAGGGRDAKLADEAR